jgi:hypothetical protein
MRLRSRVLGFKTSSGKWFTRPHPQNSQSKMDWRCGSTPRVPAVQVQSPEFKPQFKPIKKILWAYFNAIFTKQFFLF